MQPSGALTRKKILYASVQVFLKKGCEGATDKEIAALAGISSGSPFGMFGNKEGELRSAYEDSANSNTYNYVYADSGRGLVTAPMDKKTAERLTAERSRRRRDGVCWYPLNHPYLPHTPKLCNNKETRKTSGGVKRGNRSNETRVLIAAMAGDFSRTNGKRLNRQGVVYRTRNFRELLLLSSKEISSCCMQHVEQLSAGMSCRNSSGDKEYGLPYAAEVNYIYRNAGNYRCRCRRAGTYSEGNASC